MANNMSEVFFLEHRNTQIEVELDHKRIRLVVGPQLTLYLTPAEADQLSTMLLDAATGKDQYEDWDGKYDPTKKPSPTTGTTNNPMGTFHGEKNPRILNGMDLPLHLLRM